MPSVTEIDWDAWFNKPGMPIYKPNYDDSLAKVCMALKDKWISWDENTPAPFKGDDMKEFTSGQKIEFLALLLKETPLR